MVVSHTRELSNQIFNVFKSLSEYMGVSLCQVTGGTSVNKTMEDLRRNPQIVIGTPGRILDMMNKRAMNYPTIRFVAIDEADEMLSSGFVNQIHDMFKFLIENRLQVDL